MSRFLAFCMVVLSLLGSQVLAAESSPVVSARDVATLVTNRDAAGPDQTLSVGLHLKLKPGWHTYWLNPGDAGEAPTLKVTASGGQTGMSGALHFPTPVRIADGGLMSYAYVGEVTLPATLALHGTGGTTLKAHAEWLVCANTCVPESGDFTLDLPGAARDPGPGAQEPLFAQAMAAMPQPSPFTARFAPDGGLTLTGAGLSPETAKQAWFMPSVPGVIDQVAAQSLHVSDGRLTLTLKWLQRAPKTLSGIVVIRDASGQGSALWIDAGPGGAVPRDGGALPRLLGLAFLGGLILNLMPCVFPVLAMKAFSVVKIGGVARRRALMSAGAYAAGVMGSFAALGGLLLALRAAGAAAGWGFQFQSPVFVVGVCWLLLIMALNLLGAFEVTTRLGQDVPPRHGLAGDALTGLLAVVVASPCTAPFMGAAIAGALGGPVWGALAIFLAMGLGLAFPYVLIAGVPAIAARLPRPGAWMDVLRQFLAFPLLATCVWLLWVAEVQGGAAIMVLAAGGGVALGLACWLFGLAQRKAMLAGATPGVMLARGLALLIVVGALAGLGRVATLPTAAMQPGKSDGVVAFSLEALATARAAGKPVFVDMTAAWCITCMVNERVALDAPSVRRAFAQRGVVFMKGDWTNRNGTISAFLHEHGREGVPLYVYYPPHGDGQVLPQVLTPGVVAHVLDGRES